MYLFSKMMPNFWWLATMYFLRGCWCLAKILYPSLKTWQPILPLVHSKETSLDMRPPFNDIMCFVDVNMGRNSENQHVLGNIQIVQCKPNEICDPARESQYYGRGLGYVFFHHTSVIIITRHYRAGLPVLFSW